jgi:prolyl-tRNA editing enzyme YbaK/EbsC (Cys-tRNA(Pro) deacylase)
MAAVSDPLPRAARRVAEALRRAGHEPAIRVTADSTRTAAEAAAALGVRERDILKSLVFRGRESGRPVVALLDGSARVDVKALGAVLGERVERPDGAWVKQAVGYAIGGVPPVGHDGDVRVVIDSSLLDQETVWAAAGTPHTVFPVAGHALPALTGGAVAPIAAT